MAVEACTGAAEVGIVSLVEVHIVVSVAVYTAVACIAAYIVAVGVEAL